MASEMAPLAKTGGLADVVAALPDALARLGHEVRVVIPAYSQIDHVEHGLAPGYPPSYSFELGRARLEAEHYVTALSGVAVSLLGIEGMFDRARLYTDDADEGVRFSAFSRAALALCLTAGWAPEIIHCHDWQTGMIPLFVKTAHAGRELFDATRTVFTIHNLGYQGTFGSGIVDEVGLGWDAHHLHQAHLAEGWVGFLETGIMHADALTTVSPTYAREILTPDLGAGLDLALREREADLVGILNGIDTEVWNPATDVYLAHRYSNKSLWRKEWVKRDLLEGLGLSYEKRAPTFGIVSRLVEQKGIGLLLWPMNGVLEQTNARFVALGSGDSELESGLRDLAARFPDRCRFVPGFDEALAHRIEAGADIFLMPSRYEPCGLNQMYSLAYGTPPLVRRTGGLADTVKPWNPALRTGTGFVFDHYDEGGVWWALNQALEAYGDPAGWKQLQLNGMAIDNSWDRRAGEYARLYERLV